MRAIAMGGLAHSKAVRTNVLARKIAESDTPRRAGGLMSGAASKAVTH